jgi:hypothetical protein
LPRGIISNLTYAVIDLGNQSVVAVFIILVRRTKADTDRPTRASTSTVLISESNPYASVHRNGGDRVVATPVMLLGPGNLGSHLTADPMSWLMMALRVGVALLSALLTIRPHMNEVFLLSEEWIERIKGRKLITYHGRRRHCAMIPRTWPWPPKPPSEKGSSGDEGY